MARQRDQAAGERRLVEQHQGVERVAVLAQGVLDEAVVGRVAGGGEQHPVQADASGGVVHLVLVPLALRDLDRHVELHGVVWPTVAPRGRRSPFGGWAPSRRAVRRRHSQDRTVPSAHALGVIALVLLLVGGGIALAGVLRRR